MFDPFVAYLNPQLDSYLEELRALVSLDSYSYDRADVNHVVDWLEARLKTLDFDVTRHTNAHSGDSLLATRKGRGDAGRIMLLGHSDTVFPRGTTAQRPITYQGDKILGPGTCDMKAGLLVGIYAVEAMNMLQCDTYDQLTFLIVPDEEIDERDSIPLIRSTSRQNDVVLTLEAARENGDIVVARKGVRSFTAEAFGHAAHSGVEPEKGRNAIVALAHQIIALEQLNDLPNGISVNVGVVEGGRLRNIVPDHARLRFEARAFNQPDLDRVTASVLGVFERETVPGVTFKVSYEQTSPPMPYTAEIAALERMAKAIAGEMDFELNGAHTGGTADAAFAVAEGVPALDGLGPVGGLDHGPDEYILKSSIVPRIALLSKLIMAIAGSKT